MRDWRTRNPDWRGTAAELADEARRLLEGLPLGEDGVLANERLVRNYVQLGILEKPVRSGKEAYFGTHQMVEYLVARKLVAEGWPLAKIAEFTQTHGLEDLLDLLPESRPRTEAEALVAKFRQSRPASRSTSAASSQEPLPPTASPSFLSRSADWSKRKSAARDVLRALGHPTGEPERTLLVKLTMTPWCELLIDPDGLKDLPPESLEPLGEAIAHVLREELKSIRRRSS